MGAEMPAAGYESCCAQAFTEVTGHCFYLTFAPGCRRPYPFVILRYGGSALVRRRIQTPSDATVLSVVQPEGEVVLGASPPARCLRRRAGGRKRSTDEAGRALTVGVASDTSAARCLRRRAGGRKRSTDEAGRALTVGVASDTSAARRAYMG